MKFAGIRVCFGRRSSSRTVGIGRIRAVGSCSRGLPVSSSRSVVSSRRLVVCSCGLIVVNWGLLSRGRFVRDVGGGPLRGVVRFSRCLGRIWLQWWLFASLLVEKASTGAHRVWRPAELLECRRDVEPLVAFEGQRTQL